MLCRTIDVGHNDLQPCAKTVHSQCLNAAILSRKFPGPQQSTWLQYTPKWLNSIALKAPKAAQALALCRHWFAFASMDRKAMVGNKQKTTCQRTSVQGLRGFGILGDVISVFERLPCPDCQIASICTAVLQYEITWNLILNCGGTPKPL